MEKVDENDPIFTPLPSLHSSIWISGTVMYPSAKISLGPSQALKISLLQQQFKSFN